MQVIGYQRKALTFQDGRQVDGYFIYLADGTNPHVTGVTTERIYLSMNKAAGYTPALDDELRVYYNKYGKVDGVQLVS